MYYLQKVELLLEKTEYETEFQPVFEALKEKGVETVINEAWETQEKYDVKKAAADNTDGTLWITDSASLTEKIVAAGRAVLVFLHEENREQDFAGARYAFEKPRELDTEYLEQVYRRYAGRPWDILDTARCHLRETTESDVEDFCRIYADSSITEYMEDLYEPEQEREYTRKYIENVYGFYGFGVWTVLKKDTGEVIGRAGISYREGFDDPELGFVIGVPWQRQGYAYEVCEAVLQYGREQFGFAQIQALVEPENKVSLHLCAKLGMVFEGMENLQGKRYLRFVKRWA